MEAARLRRHRRRGRLAWLVHQGLTLPQLLEEEARCLARRRYRRPRGVPGTHAARRPRGRDRSLRFVRDSLVEAGDRQAWPLTKIAAGISRTPAGTPRASTEKATTHDTSTIPNAYRPRAHGSPQGTSADANAAGTGDPGTGSSCRAHDARGLSAAISRRGGAIGIAGRLVKFTKDGDYITTDDEQTRARGHRIYPARR